VSDVEEGVHLIAWWVRAMEEPSHRAAALGREQAGVSCEATPRGRLRLPAPTVSHSRKDVIIREGDPGDRYYAIADGEVDITTHGFALATRCRGEGSARWRC
jgi:hypothetical protein